MPPLPRLRVSVLADLAEQLKFTPRDAARKQLEHAEDLLHAVDAESTYPEDWLVARITGYRPDLREPA
ncbi:MAG: RNA polymerase subunit sigma-70, partial [Phycisphaerae bacterium]|nr:RNA polymerase subunit sigma-70 [Phycisphaerae bacterium]